MNPNIYLSLVEKENKINLTISWEIDAAWNKKGKYNFLFNSGLKDG